MIYINFSGAINQDTSQILMNCLAEQINRGEKEICLLLSSGGGLVVSGLTLYNFIKSLPAKVITHNIGIIDSIANVVFLAGTERYAVKHSSFLFHGVGSQVPQPTSLEEKQLRERILSVERDQNLIGEIIAKNSKLPLEKIANMFFEAQTLTPEEAKTVGIIHETKEVDIPSGSKIISLVFARMR